MKYFVKDFSTTLQARIVIFDMQVSHLLLYRGIDNQATPAYSSLYLSNFLSFHNLKMKFFDKDFSIIVQARIVIRIDDDLL